MQIVVFKSGKNRSSSFKLNGYLFIFILASMVIFDSFLFSSATFFYGYKKGYSELNEDRIQDIQRYLYEIKLIKEEYKAKMEFYNQKLTIKNIHQDFYYKANSRLTFVSNEK